MLKTLLVLAVVGAAPMAADENEDDPHRPYLLLIGHLDTVFEPDSPFQRFERISETAADLPVLLAALSSFRDQTLPNDLIVFGEVGLAGEIRPVPNGQERLREAAKLGFKRALIPAANAPKSGIQGMEIHAVTRYTDVLEWFNS